MPSRAWCPPRRSRAPASPKPCGVNDAQQKSGALAKSFELGEPGADLAKVMVASQQSQIAFRATVEVRNRLVQAYQDVMNMPL